MLVLFQLLLFSILLLLAEVVEVAMLLLEVVVLEGTGLQYLEKHQVVGLALKHR
jgi:hypothetical protein